MTTPYDGIPPCSVHGCHGGGRQTVVASDLPPYADGGVAQDAGPGNALYILCDAHLAHLDTIDGDKRTPGRKCNAHGSTGTADWLYNNAWPYFKDSNGPGSFMRTQDKANEIIQRLAKLNRKRKPQPIDKPDQVSLDGWS